MADPVAWTSLAVSLSVAVFTIWFQVLSYRRTHHPRLAVHLRQVSTIGKAEDEGPGSIGIGTALQVRVVNTGNRQVEVSQVHTQKKGQGVVWLREAHGWLGLKLPPGESKEWMEDLEPHFRKRAYQEPEASPNFLVRAVATTSDNRTFCSPYVQVQHPSGPLNLLRLRWENRLRRVRDVFRRKPAVLN
ncbi:MAG TPA: hypothetical protein VI796_00300 [Candidatus Thermoplasmatota archaeon]|nr:hypothetical protein [Candidatus Thermoplasmatota archaeon]